jgi:hypothetical protein
MLSALNLTVDLPHLTSGRACEVARLRLEARYGDGLRLTVPHDLITYRALTEGFEVNTLGEVSVSSALFEPGGLLSGRDAPLIGEIEASFNGVTDRVQVSAGGSTIPAAHLVISAPPRPGSSNPSDDQLYVASSLSEPVWSPDGFQLTSLDALSSPELLSAVGGRDRWWGLIPVSPDLSGEGGSSASGGECAPSCEAAQLSLKVTRGSWESVEGAAAGVDRPNHELSFPSCTQEAEVSVTAWLDGE